MKRCISEWHQLKNGEAELFEKITRCSIKDFKTILELGVFNNNLLNCMIYNFYQIEKMYDDNY